MQDAYVSELKTTKIKFPFCVQTCFSFVLDLKFIYAPSKVSPALSSNYGSSNLGIFKYSQNFDTSNLRKRKGDDFDYQQGPKRRRFTQLILYRSF